MGVTWVWSSTWCIACCATYASRKFGCFHALPTPSSPSKSPISSLRNVDLPEPFPPTMTAREPRVRDAEMLVRSIFSMDGYLKLIFSRVRMGLRKVRMPSGLPGSGKMKGRMSPASIISCTFPMVVSIGTPAPSEESLTDELMSTDPGSDGVFADDAADTSEGVLLSFSTPAAVATPWSARGNPAAISGLRRWNWPKVIG
mmetsp:Transcript_12810/g.28916  ORF Transcript_12810/g.28916 Transcript_12810/m.28916 type:complete len:200 (-) Transcript_12810:2373-2972(-)